jgi:hypothetical protein
MLLSEDGVMGEEPHIQYSELETIIIANSGNDSANEITILIRL